MSLTTLISESMVSTIQTRAFSSSHASCLHSSAIQSRANTTAMPFLINGSTRNNGGFFERVQLELHKSCHILFHHSSSGERFNNSLTSILVWVMACGNQCGQEEQSIWSTSSL